MYTFTPGTGRDPTVKNGGEGLDSVRPPHRRSLGAAARGIEGSPQAGGSSRASRDRLGRRASPSAAVASGRQTARVSSPPPSPPSPLPGPVHALSCTVKGLVRRVSRDLHLTSRRRACLDPPEIGPAPAKRVGYSWLFESDSAKLRGQSNTMCEEEWRRPPWIALPSRGAPSGPPSPFVKPFACHLPTPDPGVINCA